MVDLRPSVWRAAAAFWLTSMCAACGVAHDGPPKNASAAPPPAAAASISRRLLQHYDLPEMPGWESRLYLIEYGPGVAAPLHHHPVRGLGYVLSGSFESAFGDEAPAHVLTGQSFIERENAPHRLFRNPDPVKPLKFVMSFVVRVGAPVLETP